MATTKHSRLKILLIPSAITFLFCLAVIFNISPFLRGPAPYPPEWQWGYEFVNTVNRLWAPGLVGLLGMVGILYFDNKKKEKIFLFFIFFFTLILEFSTLYFSRAGIGVLLERIINPGISGYFTTALSIRNLNTYFTTFESVVAHFPMRAADHPPLAVLFFSLLLYISHFLSFIFPFVEKISLHHADIENIWKSLLPYQRIGAILSTIIIPFLSAIILIPLYFFAKIYYNEKTAVRACFLYSFVPSICLFLPLNDVFLGLFGTLGMLGIILGHKSQLIFLSVILYFLSGLALAVGIYFSMSMAVTLFIAIIFILLSGFKKRKNMVGMLGFFGGLIIVPLFLFLEFHFNSIEALIKITGLQAKRSYLPWVFYDLYDFLLFTGIPLSTFALLALKGHIKKLTKDKFVIAFFLAIFLLDVSGFSRAETGRIWMPYMPFMAIIAAGVLTNEKKINSRIFAGIIFLQLVQMLVMQEFWVTLW